MKKTLKFMLSPQFQRIGGVILIILIQLAVFAVVIYRFQIYFVYFYWFCFLLSLVASIWVSNGKARLPYKVAWIIPILLFPLFGGLIYFLLGGARSPAKLGIPSSQVTFREQLSSRCSPADLAPLGVELVQQAQYLNNATSCPLYNDTETQYFSSGEDLFPTLLDELSKAKHYIFLEFFIIASGTMWSAILDILLEKVKQGVRIYIIYDGIGSMATLPRHYNEFLEKQGLSVSVFRPVRPILSIHQNNRDHRKITVVDGTVGIVGGINLADEYINQVERFGYWKDSALLLRGSAVWSLSVMFLHMWSCIRHVTIDYDFFRPPENPFLFTFSGFVLPYHDTPLPSDTVCADLHLQMFSKAKQYLYVTTPYLIIDETITAALCITAKSGVDVRIMTPHIPDKPLIFSVTQSHYETLLKAGAKIYEFEPGFIHSKTVVVDDLYASVGSCNLDYRSFYLQFENGVWICGDPAVRAIRDDFLSSIPRCREITLADCLDISLFRRIFTPVLRLFSPLF